MYFLDTNVPIGYTVIHDKWHPQSKKFINENKNSVFWSNFVRQEYDDKLFKILKEIDKFLKSITFLLKNNEKDFYSYIDFEEFILRRTRFCELDSIKKQKILQKFWLKNDFIVGISIDIYSSFLSFVHDFETDYIMRDLKLNEIMMLHDCGLNNYLKYYDYALELFKSGIHFPDCRIIVDAHDCGLSHEDLIFISNDGKMIDTISNLDTSFLKIIEFKACDNY